MSTKTDKAALSKGAHAIRKAKAEAVTVKGKLDGTLDGATKEIIQLYNKIRAAEGKASEAAFAAYRMSFRPSLPDAVELGRLLTNVKASKRGKWLKWLKDNMPFDQKTAWRFMECHRAAG